jgi:hypothetical protein
MFWSTDAGGNAGIGVSASPELGKLIQSECHDEIPSPVEEKRLCGMQSDPSKSEFNIFAAFAKLLNRGVWY